MSLSLDYCCTYNKPIHPPRVISLRLPAQSLRRYPICTRRQRQLIASSALASVVISCRLLARRQKCPVSIALLPRLWVTGMAASRRINAPVTTSSHMVDPSRVAALVRQKPRIILGSSSSARKQLFTELAEHYGFSYEVKVAGIDEKVRSDRLRRDSCGGPVWGAARSGLHGSNRATLTLVCFFALLRQLCINSAALSTRSDPANTHAMTRSYNPYNPLCQPTLRPPLVDPSPPTPLLPSSNTCHAQAIRDPHPETLVRMLAHAKREAIIAKLKREGEKMSGLLITCDQVRALRREPMKVTVRCTRTYSTNPTQSDIAKRATPNPALQLPATRGCSADRRETWGRRPCEPGTWQGGQRTRPPDVSPSHHMGARSWMNNA